MIFLLLHLPSLRMNEQAGYALIFKGIFYRYGKKVGDC